MISIIVAAAENNAIGKDNKLLWHLPADLKRFKEITLGSTLIMGRKTFESLPGILPGRKHIVITNNPAFAQSRPNHPNLGRIGQQQPPVATSLEIRRDLSSTLAQYKSAPQEVFLIGGASLYAQGMDAAEKIYLTRVFGQFEADSYFPSIPPERFRLAWASEVLADEKSGLRFQYQNYIRIL